MIPLAALVLAVAVAPSDPGIWGCHDSLNQCLEGGAIQLSAADMKAALPLLGSEGSGWASLGYRSNEDVWLEVFDLPQQDGPLCSTKVRRVAFALDCSDCELPASPTKSVVYERVSVARAGALCSGLKAEDFVSEFSTMVGDDLRRIGEALWSIRDQEANKPTKSFDDLDACSRTRFLEGPFRGITSVTPSDYVRVGDDAFRVEYDDLCSKGAWVFLHIEFPDSNSNLPVHYSFGESIE